MCLKNYMKASLEKKSIFSQVLLEKRDKVWAEVFLDDEKLTVELPPEIPDHNDNSQNMSEIVSEKPLNVPLKA